MNEEKAGVAARQTTSAWPLDRHRIWQGLTDKAIWIEAVMGVIIGTIWTACFSSTGLSFTALYNMTFPFVPGYIATKRWKGPAATSTPNRNGDCPANALPILVSRHDWLLWYRRKALLPSSAADRIFKAAIKQFVSGVVVMSVTLISQGALSLALKGVAAAVILAAAVSTGEQLCWLYDLFADHYLPSPEPDLELGVSVYGDPSLRPVPADLAAALLTSLPSSWSSEEPGQAPHLRSH
ncbi:hypothetical protein QBC34DRAFT_431948 [Podospora aff. communis PSN243]|uniref:Uncharacterized protein n=1 Tax=Podospora aff. communis PSN243 TaxID=3040156 RepID=A0AAV9FXC1_9PEZI|nr:hypothetical protein QBC34DRAFT_431948 [Podospora aff. communis PSN243]